MYYVVDHLDLMKVAVLFYMNILLKKSETNQFRSRLMNCNTMFMVSECTGVISCVAICSLSVLRR